MSVYVFVGPTLGLAPARDILDAVYLPPVSQGDVYRAARAGASAIGIIDGYFERIPAVWHKEILWAMSQGVHVFGSASMGALRAAELSAFGMVGVGSIFEAFASGALQDDDEVAVAHGPSETGFLAISEAMVNIRATLAAACTATVLTETDAETLERFAKELFYPDRAYATVIQRARAEDRVSEARLRAFEAWLPSGRVDQKQLDAVAMLHVMRDHLAAGPAPKRVQFAFERTVWWEQATITAGELHVDGDGAADAVLLQSLLEEAQLEGETYTVSSRAAVLRTLAVRYANEASAAPAPEFQQSVADRFRRSHGLLRGAEVNQWLADNRLSRPRFVELLREQALLEWATSDLSGDINRGLPDQLRLQGDYARLLERARDKQRVLAANGWDNPSLDQAGITREALFEWYFTQPGLPGSVPVDLEEYARHSGFADGDGLFRAVLRELCYVRCIGREVSDETRAAAV